MSEIVYKALVDGLSAHRDWAGWPLPTAEGPGEWIEVKGPPRLCEWGLHGYLRRDRAEAEYPNAAIYEMEADGAIVRDHDKVAATRARLVRYLSGPVPVPFEPVLLEVGILPCVRCGRPHRKYKVDRRGTVSWADLADGHPYDKVGWEAFAADLPPGAIVEASRALVLAARGGVPPSPPGQVTAGYSPVVPSFHRGPLVAWLGHPDQCGTCGLGPELHDGWEARAALADEFRLVDRWKLLLVIQRLRREAEAKGTDQKAAAE